MPAANDNRPPARGSRRVPILGIVLPGGRVMIAAGRPSAVILPWRPTARTPDDAGR